MNELKKLYIQCLLSIPLNGFCIRLCLSGFYPSTSSFNSIEWIRSKIEALRIAPELVNLSIPLNGFFIDPWRAHTIPVDMAFNSIEWIPQQLVELLQPSRPSLSIPLNGFVEPPRFISQAWYT